MNNNEVTWLKKVGVEGQCDKCPLRKPIEQMDFSKLPCNQYQCLIKLARIEDDNGSDCNNKEIVHRPMKPRRAAVAENVSQTVNVNKLKKQLPKSSGHCLSLVKLEALVGNTYGSFEILEYVGVEEVISECHTSGKRLAYWYWARCTRCGTEQLVSRNAIQNASGRSRRKCIHCKKMSDEDLGIEDWDI